MRGRQDSIYSDEGVISFFRASEEEKAHSGLVETRDVAET